MRDDDPLRLSLPLLELRERQAPLLPPLRDQRDLSRQAGYARRDEGRKVGQETKVSQVVECATCGRAAVVVCLECHPVCGDVPKRYTGEEIEEMILRWCGWPDRTIENVRHALKMEACGGVEGGPYTPPETTT